jgi:RNase P/RNase MRP subunit POP5
MPVRSVRRRYLWIHLETNLDLDSKLLNEIIENKIHFLYGVKGAIDFNYKLIDFISENKDAIVRCNHNKLNDMRTVLAHITKIKKMNCRIDVKKVSGTIKTLRHKVKNLKQNEF